MENEEQSNLRNLSQGILETLYKTYELMQALNGVQGEELKKEAEVNGTIDELSMILADIEFVSNKLVDTITQISNRV